MNVSDFDYDLPPGLIAAHPLPHRSDSRMLLCPQGGGSPVHQQVHDILEHLQEGDARVVNDTRVLPARVPGYKKDTGGKVARQRLSR
ncbi:MAG: S-adenosylmethionine:tRNA ribosyltransferase-isomerase, partial [bacterium]|nr:S-adenosylmethionine:tRNA ribosyltransferase-isomerase [bacterium]